MIQWQDSSEKTQSSGGEGPWSNPWFGVSMGLIGVIIGYIVGGGF